MTTLVKVTCLCGDCIGTVEIPFGLPIRSITCSCDVCRYCTGVLFLTCLNLTCRPDFVDSLQAYQSSEKQSRYFCKSCGSHVCLYHHETKKWSVCAGVVDAVVAPKGRIAQLQIFSRHEFVGSTQDGGLAVCLANAEEGTVPIFLQGPDGAPVENLADQLPLQTVGSSPGSAGPERASSLSSEDVLHGGCHCGGVSFCITKPTDRSKECSSPWPDLIVPHSAHSENPDDIKWWLCENDSKYLAGTCACRSCRLASGSPIQTWAFVPKINILKANGSPLDYDLGTMKQYVSSKDTYREFCNSCGATVFWHCAERPDLVDVSVGLLRAPEGSRAENWLSWNTQRVSFKEDALDAVLAAQLERNLVAIRG